jgi:hypothetical protein
MTRDWLLTLLAISPLLFAATIAVLALARNPGTNARGCRAAETSPGKRMRGQI